MLQFRKMFGIKNFGCFKFPIFSALSFMIFVLLIFCCNSFMSNLSILSSVSENRIKPQNQQEVRSSTSKEAIFFGKEEVEDDHSYLQPPLNVSTEERIAWFEKVLPRYEILKSTRLSRKFDARVGNFLGANQCKTQFFMTWIAPVSSFHTRELFTIESLFKAHPKGCLIILSRSMDSANGYRIMKPLLDFGLKILVVTPDLPFLFEKTPAYSWFKEFKNGKIDPGEIPMTQNLSNLIRLAVLYKYGGIYLDMDFIIVNNFSSFRNSIGAQSVDIYGNWTRLNNAVLIFDKNHQLLYKFLEEFASTFDGNKWGNNGPYLVSRVVERISREKNDFNFTVLPLMAFYPVDWTKIKGLFHKPDGRSHSDWVEAKLVQLTKMTYGVHLWNKQSRRLRIEEGSIISRLIMKNCIICKNLSSF